MITDVATLCCCCCHVNVSEKELRPIFEVTENAKSSPAIVHIERDLKYIDDAIEKIKSDITNNISE
jgi:hypothetical protein